jgi:hypothetical protein
VVISHQIQLGHMFSNNFYDNICPNSFWIISYGAWGF